MTLRQQPAEDPDGQALTTARGGDSGAAFDAASPHEPVSGRVDLMSPEEVRAHLRRVGESRRRLDEAEERRVAELGESVASLRAELAVRTVERDQARDRAERAEELAEGLRGHLDLRDGELVSANQQRDQARAQLAKVREIHASDGVVEAPTCYQCRDPYPCPTIAALDPVGATEDEACPRCGARDPQPTQTAAGFCDHAKGGA